MRTLSILALSAAALAACSSAGPGSNRNAPDEFAILTKPPLTVPPDYSLRPPKPGETRPQELSTTQRTQQILLGDPNAAPPSTGELLFIQQVGAIEVDPSIRAIVGAENGGRAEKGESLTNRLLFWRFRGREIDDSDAPLVVEGRDEWMAERKSSIESVVGEDAEVTIAKDGRGILGLPGVR